MGSILALFSNWKTGLAGLGTILAVVAHLLTTVTSSGAGAITGSNIWTDVTAVVAGVGLMLAKDGNKTNSPSPLPVAQTVPTVTLKR